jgi:hypothetical protein
VQVRAVSVIRNPVAAFFDGITSGLGRFLLVAVTVAVVGCFWRCVLDWGDLFSGFWSNLPWFLLVLTPPGMVILWSGHGLWIIAGIVAAAGLMLSAYFFCQDVEAVTMYYLVVLCAEVYCAPLGIGEVRDTVQSGVLFGIFSLLYWGPVVVWKRRSAQER